MFQGFMLVHSPGAAAAIEQLSRDSRMVELIRSMDRFPTSYELIRQINSLNPDVLFLVVLNRWHPAGMSLEAVERVLRRPVHASFHEDFPAAYGASVSGGYVDPVTPLGCSVRSFVMRMAGIGSGDSTPRPKLNLAGWLPLKVKPRATT